jgi:hypothetical protein
LLKYIIISEMRKMFISASLWGRMTSIHKKNDQGIFTFLWTFYVISTLCSNFIGVFSYVFFSFVLTIH